MSTLTYREWDERLYAEHIESMSLDTEYINRYTGAKDGPRYFKPRDLTVLSGNPRFELGLSGSTRWGSCKNGEKWCLQEEGGTVQWYKVNETGCTQRLGVLEYEKVKELFPEN